MADIADIGSDATEAATAESLAAVRAKAQIKKFPFIGRCYNCERKLSEGRFCDAECRDDYEDAQKTRGGR